MNGKIKAALLVDADNLPIAQAEEALEKLAEICNPVIKKAFGDFTKSAKNWSPEFMRKHGFTPEMHFAVSNFKNGADIAMCIAAMDIVYAKSVEAIVLFTSDSDFASLAARIREAGLEVVGVGDAKASEVLRGAFDTFVVVEPPKKALPASLTPTLDPVKATPKPAKADPMPIVDLAPPAQKTKTEISDEQAKALQNAAKKKPKKVVVKVVASKPVKAIMPLQKVNRVVDSLKSQDGWYSLSAIGKGLREAGVDYRRYGHAKLSLALQTLSGFEVSPQEKPNWMRRK